MALMLCSGPMNLDCGSEYVPHADRRVGIGRAGYVAETKKEGKITLEGKESCCSADDPTGTGTGQHMSWILVKVKKLLQSGRGLLGVHGELYWSSGPKEQNKPISAATDPQRGGSQRTLAPRISPDMLCPVIVRLNALLSAHVTASCSG